MRESTLDRMFPQDANRRRSPRFGCNGLANIVCLPSDGGLLRGTIRNLSVGGCFIETGLLLPCGAQTEILARVEASSFRALAQVRAVLGRTGICVEFVRLSAGGENMLTELVSHLAKAREIAATMGLARLLDKPLDRSLDRSLDQPLAMQAETFPILRNFLPRPASPASPLVMSPRPTIIESGALFDPLDLFI